MRTIKFRGLRTDGKGWVYGGYFQHTPDEDGVRSYIFDFNEGAVEVITESVGQFTGSVDRNGNEIYEGDIVLLDEGFHPRNRPIVFSEYGDWSIGELGISFGQMKADGFVHCEVIGNIYQNPELLERSAKADA